MKKPLVLMILDGWGLNDHKDQKNAIREAGELKFDKYWNNYQHTVLQASGEAVGLPQGQMGNSEVGHLNLGAGRVVYQPLVKISKEVETKNIYKNEALAGVMKKTKEAGKALHFTGLLSDGGIHSHIKHLFGLLEMAKEFGLKEVYVHALLDGRDTPPKSAINFIEELEAKMEEIGVGKIASLAGRFYTMDRDKRWERVEKGYYAIVNGAGNKALSAVKAVERAYDDDVTDEFVKPTVITDKAGNPTGHLKDGDGFIFFNFRPDRAREITHAILDEEFDGFIRTEKRDVNYVCMTPYEDTIKTPIAYPPEDLTNTLGEVLSKNGLKQFRTAETEKYAHVTFFFNGGQEKEFDGEVRKLVSSPKVETYDLQPEMSAEEVKEGLLEALDKDEFDVVIINFANPDMVGHTGSMEAAIKAVKTVDSCMDQVAKKVLGKSGTVLVTADHGNVDLMENPTTHAPHTAHTTNPVPLILISDEHKDKKFKDGGKLADISPTMLELLGIEKPKEMNGESLIKK